MARILLAEQQADYSFAISGALRRLGHLVDIAETSKSAADLFQTHSYALLIVDTGLPTSTGLTFVANLQKQNGDVLPPVIFLISNGELGPGLNAAAADALDPYSLIRMPTSLERLAKTVEDALSSSACS